MLSDVEDKMNNTEIKAEVSVTPDNCTDLIYIIAIATAQMVFLEYCLG